MVYHVLFLMHFLTVCFQDLEKIIQEMTQEVACHVHDRINFSGDS